ncbi:MAG: heavy metal translocating P-type ATPase [Clostridia bacterium]|nr:heavy metal translocating P-type ATPase [Clostridia bacterium]
MKKITLGISGMSCSACSNGLEKHLNSKEGIISSSVNLIMANATISYDETLLDQKKIEAFIKQAGFKSTGIFDIKKEEKKQSLVDIIVFACLTTLMMYVSMGHMINLPMPYFCDININPVGYLITLFVLVTPFLVYGIDIFISGFKNAIKLSPNMDTLVTLGVFAALGFSIYASIMVFLGDLSFLHSIYFEACTSVVFFIKLGRRIDRSSKEKTKKAIKSLVSITPEYALVKRGDITKKVTIDEVNVGDIIVCRAGEKFPVDGKVVNGSCHVDESFITGESKPSLKEVGSQILAGSINFDGYVELSAEKIGKNSTVSEIVHLVVEASNTKLPIAKTVDKVCQIFVPSVIVIALLTFVGYMIFGQGFEKSLITCITVLVVACPCALGLATPLAVIVGEGACAAKGILVKNGKALEIGNKITTVVFDKTGTLTYGNLKISKIYNYSFLIESDFLTIVSSVESLSTHPISGAFKGYLAGINRTPKEVKSFKEFSGKGIYGEVDDTAVLLGNAKLLEDFNITNPYKHLGEEIVNESSSVIYVVFGKKVVGVIGVNDIVKDEAIPVINELKNLGIKTVMISGDNSVVANKIAATLGIEKVYAEVLPKDKANLVQEMQASGEYVLMCGDGINDSPALTTANIGVAVKNGTDVAIDSADVVLMTDDLNKLIDFLTISKQTIKCIKQNLFWAFFYNCLMIPIAISSLISPMIASIAMVLSSLTVIFNALRMKTNKK